MAELNAMSAAVSVVKTIYKRLVERGGDSLTYGEWAQVGDAVDPIPGRVPIPSDSGG